MCGIVRRTKVKIQQIRLFLNIGQETVITVLWSRISSYRLKKGGKENEPNRKELRYS